MENHAFAPERRSLSLCCDLSPHVRRRELAWLLHRHYWACAATSRERTRARGRQTRRQDTEFISPLCLRHNKQEWNCKAADGALRIPNERRREGWGGASGDPKGGGSLRATLSAAYSDSCHCNTWHALNATTSVSRSRSLNANNTAHGF